MPGRFKIYFISQKDLDNDEIRLLLVIIFLLKLSFYPVCAVMASTASRKAERVANHKLEPTDCFDVKLQDWIKEGRQGAKSNEKLASG